MSSNDESPSISDQIPTEPESPLKETIPIGQGGFPWIIRYMIHFIILGTVIYVIYQPESNYINYINAVLLLISSGNPEGNLNIKSELGEYTNHSSFIE